LQKHAPGDAIDRGDRLLDCLNYIRKTKGIHFLLGNHELMMLLYYSAAGGELYGQAGLGFKTFYGDSPRGVVYWQRRTRTRHVPQPQKISNGLQFGGVFGYD
jgi:hypothetical protein